MVRLAAKLPVGVLVMPLTLVATLGVAVHVQHIDLFLASFTGAFATLGALLAAARMGMGFSSARDRYVWQLAFAIFALVAVGEFAEPFSEQAEQNLGIDNIDDLLLLLVAPVALWLCAKLEPVPKWARVAVVAGFVLQIVASMLDLADAGRGPAFGIATSAVKDYAELAQFLSMQCYLLAVLLTFIELNLRTSQQSVAAKHGKDLGAQLLPLLKADESIIAPRALQNLVPPPIPRERFRSAHVTDVDYLHGIAVQAAWALASPLERALFAVAIACWPLVSLALAVSATARAGRQVRATSGKSLLRQLVEQLDLAINDSIPPKSYYVLELWRDELRSRSCDFLLRTEKLYLSRIARDRTGRRPIARPFVNKARLIDSCLLRDVRAVQYYATLHNGDILAQKTSLDRIFSSDLFVKPLIGKGGRGAECYVSMYQAFRDQDDRQLSRSDLLLHLKRWSAREKIIVQPRVQNHPALRDLAPRALCTVRVVTCENERDEVEVTDAVLRMPSRPGAVLDTFHADGIAAAVTLSTGVLSRATGIGSNADSRWHSFHPVTHAPIEGRALPFWSETLDLACRAHRAVSDRDVVGWDIAVLPDGPAIIEAHGSPDLDILQRTQLRPIGTARLGRLLSWRLAHVLSGPTEDDQRQANARQGVAITTS
jgi:putative polysaccharide biosynthesis protein